MKLMKMNYSAIIVTLVWILITLMLIPCSSLPDESHRHHHHAQSLRHPSDDYPEFMSRKLKLTAMEVKSYISNVDVTMSYKREQNQAVGLPAGNGIKKEAIMKRMHEAASKGTWQEWLESSEASTEFFTMDYSHVRRRRPVHNKFVPAAAVP